MKLSKITKLTLVTFSLVLFVMVAKSQTTNTQTKKNVNTNDPEITFENIVHNYDTIKKGSDGACEFKFKNTGKEPLILSNVRSSCGCTVPTWPKDPILPGKTGVINVVYDTQRVGGIYKSITVLSNAKTSTVVLSIKGMVIE